MKSTAQIIDDAKDRLGVTTDSALSGYCQRPRSHFNDIRRGRRWFNRTDIPYLAYILDREPMELLIELEASRADNPDMIASAHRVLGKLRGTAAGAALAAFVAVGGMSAPTPAVAGTDSGGLYIMLN